MVVFQAELLRSEEQGTAMLGWIYVDVPLAVAQQIKPDYRQVYRVKGIIDGHLFSGLALMPKGEGDYILAVNGSMRKVLKKGEGDVIFLQLEEDTAFRIDIPADLEICLSDSDLDLMSRFMALPKSHRNYFIKYINEAKTEPTRTKRIAMTVEAMELGLDFGAMIRLDKAKRRNS